MNNKSDLVHGARPKFMPVRRVPRLERGELDDEPKTMVGQEQTPVAEDQAGGRQAVIADE